MVLFTLALHGGARLDPWWSARINSAVTGPSIAPRCGPLSADFDRRLASLEARVSEIEPGQAQGTRVIEVTDPHPVRTALVGRLNSLYSFLFAATFMPFLVFFMLAAKRQVWHATMQLFPATQRTEVKDALADVTRVLRSYLMGTALVGLILVIASWLFFHGLGARFPVPDGACFRAVQSGPVPGRCDVVDSAALHRAQAISHDCALIWGSLPC